MEEELKSAVDFLTTLLEKRKVDENKVAAFGRNLEDILTSHYEGHWFPLKPTRGSAYRCVRINRKMDENVQKAAQKSGLTREDLLKYLPSELTLWIDPHDVSYRIGEEGSVGLLYENEEGKALAKEAEREEKRRKREEKGTPVRRQLSGGSSGSAAESPHESPSSSPTSSPEPQCVPPTLPVPPPQQPPQHNPYLPPQHQMSDFYPDALQNVSPPPGMFNPRLPQAYHPQQIQGRRSPPQLHPGASAYQGPPPPPHVMKQHPFRQHQHPSSYPAAAAFRQHQQQQWMQQQQQQQRGSPPLCYSPVSFLPQAGPLSAVGRRTPSPVMTPADLARSAIVDLQHAKNLVEQCKNMYSDFSLRGASPAEQLEYRTTPVAS